MAVKSNNSFDEPIKVPLDEIVPIREISGDDEEDTALLRQMAEVARRYIQSFDWCAVVLEGYFGGGAGGIFAIFLFHIVPTKSESDEWMWIVVGDLPSIYLHLVDAPRPKDVFEMYVDGLTKWVTHVRSEESEVPDDVPPIDVPPTPQWADDIERRAKSLKEILGPLFSE
jgi:hypothetical protein